MEDTYGGGGEDEDRGRREDGVGEVAAAKLFVTDVVFTPAADIIFSAANVGVLRHQVRARKIELLGLILYSV